MCRVLAKHGRSLEGIEEVAEPLVVEQPVLASCYGASASDVQLLGAQPGQRTGPVGVASKPNALAVEVGGVKVHAGPAIDGRDRRRIERLVRYMARPPLAQDRVALHEDGRVRIGSRRRGKVGPTRSCSSREPLLRSHGMARLCALIPPPRFHLVRYHGVLAANAKARSSIVPKAAPKPAPEPQLVLHFDSEPNPLAPAPPSSSRHPWPWLLQRVFAVDILTCPRCQGTMRLVEIATEPEPIRAHPREP